MNSNVIRDRSSFQRSEAEAEITYWWTSNISDRASIQILLRDRGRGVVKLKLDSITRSKVKLKFGQSSSV